MDRHPSRGLTFALAIASVLGCATGDRPSGTSGFLGDYSNLAKGRSNQARLVYLHPGVDFSAYDAIIIDPIVVWDAVETRASLDPPGEFLEQAHYFQRALREHLQDLYQLVEAPQPRALRLRMAIIEGLGSGVNIECELTDSVTHERLIAAVDQRKLPTPTKGADSAAAAKRIYDRWAEIIRNRLAALRDFDASQKEADAASAH